MGACVGVCMCVRVIKVCDVCSRVREKKQVCEWSVRVLVPIKVRHK